MARAALALVPLLAVACAAAPLRTDPGEKAALLRIYQEAGGSGWTSSWPVTDPNSDPCGNFWFGLVVPQPYIYDGCING